MNTLFFYISKILWALLSPASFLFLLLIAGIGLLFLKKIPAARILLGTAAVLMTLVAFLPLGKWLVTPLEAHFPTNPSLPDSIDGIIMLGGAIDPVNSYIWDQPQLGSAAERYTAFITLARTYPEARLVFTGGSGSIVDQDFREADIALYFLESMGIESQRVEFERDSRNTFENAVNSKELLNPAADEQWLLITSAAHMPRSVGTFCKQGWPIIPYPVDHESSPGRQMRIEFNFVSNLGSFNNNIKEWLGLLVYYLTDRTDQLLPEGCH